MSLPAASRLRRAAVRIVLLGTTACAHSQSVRLGGDPPSPEILARVTIEDLRPAEEKETRTVSSGTCSRIYGDAFLEPNKIDYLRGLLAGRLAPAAPLAIRLERFETTEHCEATQRRSAANSAGAYGALGALIAKGVAGAAFSGTGVGDAFELHLAGTANGKPFAFRRRFDYSDIRFTSFPSESQEYRRRIQGLFEAFAGELRGGQGVAAVPAARPVQQPSPAPSAVAPANRGRDLTPAPSALPADLSRELERCSAGAADACARAAQRYARGDGVAKDGPRAARLHLRACDGGQGESCSLLGKVSEAGNATREDLERAAELYRKGCGAGSNFSCLRLGRFYQDGRGVPRDIEEAGALYQRACDGGEARACDAVQALGR